MLKKIKQILFLPLILLFISCSSLKSLNTSEMSSIIGSIWKYSDEDWTYTIKFKKNGKIKTTHPNDNTPENDYWNQSSNIIHFEFNDGYSKYKGKMKSTNLIVGKGKSPSGKWKWQLKRIEY